MASSCVYINDVKRTAFREDIMVFSFFRKVYDFIQEADRLCNPIINHHNAFVLNWINYAKNVNK